MLQKLDAVKPQENETRVTRLAILTSFVPSVKELRKNIWRRHAKQMIFHTHHQLRLNSNRDGKLSPEDTIKPRHDKTKTLIRGVSEIIVKGSFHIG